MAEEAITAPRDSSRGSSLRLGEPVANGKGEAGKDVAAFKVLVFPQDERAIALGKDANLPAFGIDVPNLKHAGPEVLVELARHLARGVSLAEDFHDQVGCHPGNLAALAPLLGITLP